MFYDNVRIHRGTLDDGLLSETFTPIRTLFIQYGTGEEMEDGDPCGPISDYRVKKWTSADIKLCRDHQINP